MHTIWAREHNRIAKELGKINPHWDDETLFQESRRIVIAEIQHIAYNEFLPTLLGKGVMEKFGLLLQKEVIYKFYKVELKVELSTWYSYNKAFWLSNQMFKKLINSVF